MRLNLIDWKSFLSHCLFNIHAHDIDAMNMKATRIHTQKISMPAWLPACLPDCLSGVHGRYSNMPHFNWVLLNWRFQPIHKHHQPHSQPLHERKIEPMMTAKIKTQQKNVKKLLQNFNELTAVHFQNSGQPLTSYQCFEHLKHRCVCVRVYAFFFHVLTREFVWKVNSA